VKPDGTVPEIPEARQCPVTHAKTPLPPPPPPQPQVVQAPVRAAVATASPRDTVDLRKREWIMDVVERQRSLSAWTSGLHTRHQLGRDEFLDQYYAASRPVLLTGELDDWPALRLWTAEYLREKVGTAEIEYQGGRASNAAFERDKIPHRQRLSFDRYMDLIAGDTGNDAYITAYNSEANAAALAPLEADLGFLDKFLKRDPDGVNGMMWIGPLGTFTPLHHDLTNNLLAQIQGTKRIILAPPSEAPKLYNSHTLFSDVFDLMDPDLERFPLAAEARLFEVDLEAGQCLFIPVGWWHQVTSLDFSVTVTYTNFHWPNDAHETYPRG